MGKARAGGRFKAVLSNRWEFVLALNSHVVCTVHALMAVEAYRYIFEMSLTSEAPGHKHTRDGYPSSNIA